MIATLSTIVVIIAAAVSVISAVIHSRTITLCRQAYRALLLSDGESVGPARVSYNRLSSLEKRLGLVVIACYGLGALTTYLLGHGHGAWLCILILMLSVMFVTGSSIFRISESSIRIEIENLRSQEEFSKLRESRNQN